MIALLQRVDRAVVEVAGQTIAAIERGLLVFVGVERDDGEQEAARLLERLLAYRVFPDETGRMNRSLAAAGGALMLVPQFTLAADTRKGNRPSFTPAAPPASGERLFLWLVDAARRAHPEVTCGRFGAAMKIALVNDGPVTFWLQVNPRPDISGPSQTP